MNPLAKLNRIQRYNLRRNLALQIGQRGGYRVYKGEPEGSHPYIVEVKNRQYHPRKHPLAVPFVSRDRHDTERFIVDAFINRKGEIYIKYDGEWKHGLISYDEKGFIVDTGVSYVFLPCVDPAIKFRRPAYRDRSFEEPGLPLNLAIATTGEEILKTLLEENIPDSYKLELIENSGVRNTVYDVRVKRPQRRSILIDFKGVYKVKLNRKDKKGHLVMDCRHLKDLANEKGIPVLAYSQDYSLFVHKLMEEVKKRNEHRLVKGVLKPGYYVNFGLVHDLYAVDRKRDFNPRFVFVRKCKGLRRDDGEWKQKNALLSTLEEDSLDLDTFVESI